MFLKMAILGFLLPVVLLTVYSMSGTVGTSECTHAKSDISLILEFLNPTTNYVNDFDMVISHLYILTWWVVYGNMYF